MPTVENRQPENAPLRSAVDNLKASLESSFVDDPAIQNMIFQQILALIKGWFAKKKKPELPPPDVIVPDKPAPTPTPAPSPTFASVPSHLELKIKGVKRQGKHISNAEVQRVRDLSDPVNTEGDVVNLDAKAFDSHGAELEVGSKALEGLLVDPTYGTYLNVGDEMTYRYDDNGNPYPTNKPWPEGYDNHRCHLIVSGPADQGGEYRNYGLGINLNPTSDGEITAYLECKRADGVVIKSNTIKFRAKYWQS